MVYILAVYCLGEVKTISGLICTRMCNDALFCIWRIGLGSSSSKWGKCVHDDFRMYSIFYKTYLTRVRILDYSLLLVCGLSIGKGLVIYIAVGYCNLAWETDFCIFH